MPAPWNPPVKGEEFEFDICLESYSDSGSFLNNPTIATGDVVVVKDNGASANITTLPTVAPAASGVVRVQLSATEMNADKVTVLLRDATVPKQWCDAQFTIMTTS